MSFNSPNVGLFLPQQVLTYMVVYTSSKIKSRKKSCKIFDFKSRDSTFYKATEKRGDVGNFLGVEYQSSGKE